ncbi:MAG: GDP-L-fucose synthase [Planctomycetota bacterium]
MSHEIQYGTDRLLITGGQGFLGSHLRDELHRRGCPDELLFTPAHAEYELTEEAEVERMYAELRPDVVYHLAAEVGGIGANAAHPGRFFQVNFAMGLHLIEHARRRGLKKFLHCGTVCAYPERATMPFTEDQFWTGYPAEPTAPYGIAKMSLGVMLDGYRREYGLASTTVIPVNLYGPRDDFELGNAHVMAALVRKFVEAVDDQQPTVTVWGSGRASREFLYVTDAARGLAAAAERVSDPHPINLGSGVETPIAELANRIADATGFTGEVVWDRTKPDGQPRRCLSTERSQAELDWSAQMPLDRGIAETVRWYREHRPATAEA